MPLMTANVPHARAPTTARIAVTATVTLAEAAHLAWEQAQGGIVSHHLLADPGLPALWNGWGLLVLPALAWIASSRLVRATGHGGRLRRPALVRLAAALLAGVALAVAFTAGRSDIAGGLFIAIAMSGLVVRVYRSEYLLGFVLGMAITFGALLPTMIGGAIALASAAVWFGIWRPLGRLGLRLRSARA